MLRVRRLRSAGGLLLGVVVALAGCVTIVVRVSLNRFIEQAIILCKCAVLWMYLLTVYLFQVDGVAAVVAGEQLADLLRGVCRFVSVEMNVLMKATATGLRWR